MLLVFIIILFLPAMNNIVTNPAISAVISKLKEQKEKLANEYSSAINNGEKFEIMKTLYLTLKDVDKKLNDLLRCSHLILQ